MSSGLARRGRAGTGAYAAGKAAVDRLTETIAVEESDLLGLVLAVAPGVVETDMQRTMRRQPESVLHDVAMFRRFRDEGAMNTPAWVGRHIADWAFGEAVPPAVVVRVPDERSGAEAG
jgi:benzil reductase ((S)-benzoin forming)